MGTVGAFVETVVVVSNDVAWERVERPVAHQYETGGLRRVWVRGHENARKRVLIQAAGCNLGLLLRHLTGVGSPRAGQPASAPWPTHADRDDRRLGPAAAGSAAVVRPGGAGRDWMWLPIAAQGGGICGWTRARKVVASLLVRPGMGRSPGT